MRKTKPARLGSIGCLSASPAKFGRKNFTFNGTTLDLVKQAVALGAKAGDTIKANYGGGMRVMKLHSAPHDTRVGGVWCAEVVE